ncbi:MAG TPA: glycosyltransferase family 4 protein [Mycobacteriales bacterium]|nr:glycosyltransferase family 4 protein [Mycobacteriales bacterium]
MQRRLAALNLEAEVVHAHFGQVAWIARSAGMCPLVASFYGSDASSGAVLRRWASRYTELFADRGLVVAEGPAMVERLVALGADRTRTRVLPLMAPVDTVPWHPPSTAGRIEVLMAGRLVAKKGFGLGLAAFAEVSGRHDVALTVMGSGPEDQTLRANAGRLGVLDRVRFIPFADRSAFWAALANADVLLQPSRVAPDGDAEGGAPTVILDAQARGCVLVVSDHADIPFIVDPDAAYLSHESDLRDLINKLEAACRTRDEWTERSARGRAHMEAQHSPTAVAARRDAIYTEALALNRRTGVSRGVG